MKIAVALSGGVDSTAVALRLLRAGHEVFGITMQVCPDLSGLPRSAAARPARPGLPAHGCALCEAPCACVDATAAAQALGIRLELLDLRAPFEEKVIAPFVDEFFAGRTPNPCAFCNREMKFGLLRRRALDLGAEAFATGHYLRLESGGAQPVLRRALDPARDQSYFLALVPVDNFTRVLFPLGESYKTENQAEVSAAQVHAEPPVTSNEICFLRDVDYVDFLRLRRPAGFAAGEITDTGGKVLGRHAGLPGYTVGQRRGLGVAAPEALYVLRLEAESNRVVAGNDAGLWTREVKVRACNWLAPLPPPGEALLAQIRYRQQPLPARVTAQGTEAQIEFQNPVRAVTPGQVAAVYAGDRLLGGGIIA
jgi:tRNA-uridine 2-sulfurtransferase